MIIFFLWLLLLLLLGFYVWFIWRRTATQSRFQARLTILFILFVMVPTLPLTFFMSYVLTRSSQMLTQPGVDRALRYSLEVLHDQMDVLGEAAWSRNQQPHTMTPPQLRQAGIRYCGRIDLRDDRASLGGLTLSDSLGEHPDLMLQDEPAAQWRERNRHGILRTAGAESYYEYFRLQDDSTLVVIGLPMPAGLMHAKALLERAVNSYATLGLLRDSFLEQGLVWVTALLLVLLLSLLAVIIARIISRDISHPIRALTSATRSIGAGDLSQRVQVRAKDEIQFLIASFNRMAEDLQKSRENLQRAERAAAWRDAARQVSHEIKNPLTPIQLSLYRLRTVLPAETRDLPDLQESFRIIEEELVAMRRLADEFAEFARMPALQFHFESLNEIVAQAVRLAEAGHPSVLFNLYMDVMPEMQLDAEQLRAAIYNVLKNAAEASAPGAAVEVSLRRSAATPSQVQLIIRDHGHGMDEVTLQKAAQPYFTTKNQGTGLGLVIVRRIVQEHGGQMRIESEKERGTTVTMEW